MRAEREPRIRRAPASQAREPVRPAGADLDVQVARQLAALRQSARPRRLPRRWSPDRHRGRETGQAQRESAGREHELASLRRARRARRAAPAPPALGREDVEAEVDRRAARRSKARASRGSAPRRAHRSRQRGVCGSSATGERSIVRTRLEARERPRPGGHARRAAAARRARRRAGRPPPRARSARRPRSRRSPSRPPARAGRSRCAARAAPAARCRPRRSPRARRSDAGRASSSASSSGQAASKPRTISAAAADRVVQVVAVARSPRRPRARTRAACA